MVCMCVFQADIGQDVPQQYAELDAGDANKKYVWK